MAKIVKILRYFLIFYLIGFLVTIDTANAHSGRTDKNGCHNDNKNGGYHCHNSGDSSSSGGGGSSNVVWIVVGVVVASGVGYYIFKDTCFVPKKSHLNNDKYQNKSSIDFTFSPTVNDKALNGIFSFKYSF